jgi:hypothetical protein
MSQPTNRPYDFAAMSAEDLLSMGALTVDRAVDFSGLSESELWLLVGRGTLPSFKPRRERLIPKRAIVLYMAALFETTQTPEGAKPDGDD